MQVDYLLWWIQGQRIPTLATTLTGDRLLGGRLDSDSQNGLRVRGGTYFDCDGTCGLMVDFFGLDTSRDRVGVAGGGMLLPFTDMDLSNPANQTPGGCGCLAELVGTATDVPLDSLQLTSGTDVFSAGLYGRSRLNSWYDCCRQDCCCNGGLCRCGFRLDALYGYRYFSLDESLRLAAVVAPPTGTITAIDRFRTENEFHGFDMGFVYEVERGRWSLATLGRVALGINNQRLTIAGEGNRGGGLFAHYTNAGVYEHDAFTAIPEVNVTLSYALTCHLRARFGYSFLLLSNVIRPGSQVDTRVDGRFFDATQPVPLTSPDAFFPEPRFETESVWLQGLNFGLEYWF